MEVIITNDEREDLFAAIRYEAVPYKVEWAEVIFDAPQNTFVLTIFPPPDGEDRYVFSLTEVQDALERARQRLIERGYEVQP